MNVIVVPDAAMIVIPLIEKNGHSYLSPSDFSKYDNMDICEGNLTYDNLLLTYSSSEIPSGIRGRLFLLSRILNNADAAIIIGKRPKFGGNACNNAHSLTVKMVEDLGIPTLKLAYPTNQNQLIDLINKTNSFLKNLNHSSASVNDDGLTVDFEVKKDKYPIEDVKNILNKLI